MLTIWTPTALPLLASDLPQIPARACQRQCDLAAGGFADRRLLLRKLQCLDGEQEVPLRAHAV